MIRGECQLTLDSKAAEPLDVYRRKWDGNFIIFIHLFISIKNNLLYEINQDTNKKYSFEF